MLSNNQINRIEAALIQSQVFHSAIRSELLDHVCCMIEIEMNKNIGFDAALKRVFQVFNEDEMREIQLEKLSFINQNQSIMYKLSLLSLFALLFITAYVWAAPIDPPTIHPVKNHYEISSGFGMRLHPYKNIKKMHTGIDIKAPAGTLVVATADAIVLKVVKMHDKHGNYIILKHDDEYQTKYSHLLSVNVQEGDIVKLGETIGKVGSTGISTAPHLHYEVLKNEKAVDPANYIRQ